MSQTDFHPDQLREYVLQVCAKLGSEPTEAGLVADQLIRANLCGHDSHGIGMMPTYVDAVHEGRLFPNRHSSVAVDSGAVLVIGSALALWAQDKVRRGAARPHDGTPGDEQP